MTKAFIATALLSLSFNAGASLAVNARCQSMDLDLKLQSNGNGGTIVATLGDATSPNARTYTTSISAEQLVAKLSTGTKFDGVAGQGGTLLVKYDGVGAEISGDANDKLQCQDLNSDNVDGKLDAMGQ